MAKDNSEKEQLKMTTLGTNKTENMKKEYMEQGTFDKGKTENDKPRKEHSENGQFRKITSLSMDNYEKETF